MPPWDAMDVYDAGVYVTRHEAAVPKGLRAVLWGPLQAKELGLDGWEVQDGGETGYVFHHRGRAGLGRLTATLIVVRRLRKAFLTSYLAGFPSDAPEAQRRSAIQTLVGQCEVLLTRLAKEPVQFEATYEHALVHHEDHAPAAAEQKDDDAGSSSTIDSLLDRADPGPPAPAAGRSAGSGRQRPTLWEV
ncbi:MAG: hypothetical protein ACPGQL_09415 [Thermoplasmatota archaeon]